MILRSCPFLTTYGNESFECKSMTAFELGKVCRLRGSRLGSSPIFREFASRGVCAVSLRPRVDVVWRS